MEESSSIWSLNAANRSTRHGPQWYTGGLNVGVFSPLKEFTGAKEDTLLSGGKFWRDDQKVNLKGVIKDD